ncbi:MAG: ATP-binding cassette domain-containing protein [Ignisphaera sp.]|uniref:ATP-binding cassette domain-containing protein n=1 Tax=Ignisphaera aggregans TaxID=334771 RepID=A0A7C4NTJ4_9CREN
MSILLLDRVSIAVGEKIVLRDIDLRIDKNEVLFLLGPNGAGKSTLLRALIGYPGHLIVSGKIYFEGEDVTELPMEARVAKGLAFAHQIPPKLLGVRVKQLLEALCRKNICDVYEIANEIGVLHLLDREFGKGFSGGELKRIEVATLMAQKPKLPLIDEPDSGVDVDSIEVIARAIKKLIDLSPYRSAILVTHSALISRYIEPTKVCILMSGTIKVCDGKDLIDEVFRHGFRELA